MWEEQILSGIGEEPD